MLERGQTGSGADWSGMTDVFALKKRERDPAKEIVTVDGSRVGLGRDE